MSQPESKSLEGYVWLSLEDSEHLYVGGNSDSAVSLSSVIDETCHHISQPLASQWAVKLRQFADRLDSIPDQQI